MLAHTSRRREFCVSAAQGITAAAMTIRPIFSGYPFQGESWTVLRRGFGRLRFVLGSLFLTLARISHFLIKKDRSYSWFLLSRVHTQTHRTPET